jgi:hypothetical protein
MAKDQTACLPTPWTALDGWTALSNPTRPDADRSAIPNFKSNSDFKSDFHCCALAAGLPLNKPLEAALTAWEDQQGSVGPPRG